MELAALAEARVKPANLLPPEFDLDVEVAYLQLAKDSSVSFDRGFLTLVTVVFFVVFVWLVFVWLVGVELVGVEFIFVHVVRFVFVGVVFVGVVFVHVVVAVIDRHRGADAAPLAMCIRVIVFVVGFVVGIALRLDFLEAVFNEPEGLIGERVSVGAFWTIGEAAVEDFVDQFFESALAADAPGVAILVIQ
jgi:hypothetical protein